MEGIITVFCGRHACYLFVHITYDRQVLYELYDVFYGRYNVNSLVYWRVD